MIVRDLITKLSFKLDEAGFNKYKRLSDQVKINNNKNDIAQHFSYLKSKYDKNEAYRKDLKQNLSKEEIKNVLAYNNLEKQAIKDVAKEKLFNIKEEKRQKLLAHREFSQRTRNFKNNARGALYGTPLSGVFNSRIGLTALGALGIGLTIKKTIKEFEDYKKGINLNNGVKFDKEQFVKLQNLSTSFKMLNKNVTEFRNNLTLTLAPIITDVVRNFNEWYNVNQKVINQNIKEFFDSLTKNVKVIYNAVKPVVSFIDNIVTKTIGWKNLIETATYSIIGWKTISVISTIVSAIKSGIAVTRIWASGMTLASAVLGGLSAVGITAISVAVGLLIEDFVRFKEGGNSVIKDVLESDAWLKFKNVLDSISEYINGTVNSFKSLSEQFSKLFELHNNKKLEIKSDIKLDKSSITDMPEIVHVKRVLSDEEYDAMESAKYYSSDAVKRSVVARSVEPVVNIKIDQHGVTGTGGLTDSQVKSIGDMIVNEISSFNEKLLEQEKNAIGVY